MGTGRVIAALAASLIVCGTAFAADTGGINPFAHKLLAAQNEERDRVGVPRLEWSGKLAQDAQAWADVLAREGNLRHAPPEVNPDEGENLWMGGKGYYGAEAMIGTFLDEKKAFKHGTFPQVSTTGNWQDVGHYTQIVWRNTRQVGCAVAQGRDMDFLVCRYFPAGNWRRQPVF
jgi:uncharacterized protein YkwD